MKPYTLEWWLTIYAMCVVEQILAHNNGCNNEKAAEMTIWIFERITDKYGE
jgi:hypothetical protein